MKRNLFYMAVIACLSVVFSLPAFSQTATVQGTCKDAQGNPITGAQVTWHNTDTGRTYNIKTDKKGKYFSLGIDVGTYTVSLNKDGKELDKVNGYKVQTGEANLDFDLKAAQQQQIEQTAKEKGLTPDQVKQQQEQNAKIEEKNKNIGAVNEKLKAATAAEQGNPPNYDSAIATLTEATQMAPDEDLVWFRLGGAYLDSAKIQTDAAEKTKRYTEAYNDLHKALDIYKSKNEPAAATNPSGAAPGSANPGSANPGGAAPAQGAPANGQAQGQGQTAQPAKNAVQQVAEKQRLAAYYDNFANAAAHVGKSSEAVDAYNQAAQLDPAHAGQYYFNLGAILTNSNTSNDVNIRKQAIDAFDKAIAADPNHADAYFWKAQNLIGMATADASGKIAAPDGTTEAYQKYLELQPTGPHAEEAKQMLAALNASIQTSYGKKNATPKKKP